MALPETSVASPLNSLGNVSNQKTSDDPTSEALTNLQSSLNTRTGQAPQSVLDYQQSLKGLSGTNQEIMDLVKQIQMKGNQPNWGELTQAFFSPTKTGSFGETIANVGGAYGKSMRESEAQQLPMAQLRMSMGQKELELKQGLAIQDLGKGLLTKDTKGNDVLNQNVLKEMMGVSPAMTSAYLANLKNVKEFNKPEFQKLGEGEALFRTNADGTLSAVATGNEKLDDTLKNAMRFLNIPLDAKMTPEQWKAVEAKFKELKSITTPQTKISINTGETYGAGVAKTLAGIDSQILESGRSAPDIIASSHRIKSILDTGKPITGTLAEQRLAVTKALATAGLIKSDSVNDTMNLVTELSNNTLSAIKSSGLGSGQGFTDKDLKFLQGAKSGNIELTPENLRYLADLNERVARKAIEKANRVAERIAKQPAFSGLGMAEDLQIPMPPEYSPSKFKVVE